MESTRELMRHTLATVAYRATRALDGAPEEFGHFDGAGRRPVEIVAHMGDLFDWSLSMAKGEPKWKVSTPLEWALEKQRFFVSLRAFDEFLASGDAVHAPMDRLLQAPVADALTHVGQLAMLRRLAGCAIAGENYYVASIAIGQLAEQPAPVQRF